ncbi:hypothetical protein [Candidatus Palauibacter sp.]|uniref:hypothetical protein n=1 Tax=Candidatus Palauibacter sp. TaxID=3101350 RepID=UPI003B5AB688
MERGSLSFPDVVNTGGWGDENTKPHLKASGSYMPRKNDKPREHEEATIQVGLRWNDDGSPAVAADQFILQRVDNQFQLVIGHAPFPLVLGTPKEQRAEVEKMGTVPVHVRGRFVLQESALRSLIAMLNERASQEGW